MTNDADGGEQDQRSDVEARIMDDDRRRNGEFLREFLARNRVDPQSETQIVENS